MNKSIIFSAYTQKVLDQINSPITQQFENNEEKCEVYSKIITRLVTFLLFKFTRKQFATKKSVEIYDVDYSVHKQELSLEERNYIIYMVWRILFRCFKSSSPEYICILKDGNEELCNVTFEITKL